MSTYRDGSQPETDEEGSGSRRWVGLAVVALLIVAAIVAWRLGYIEPRGIADWLESVGGEWWAPIAFIGLYIVFNVLLIPATALTLTAGIVWGWVEGGLWVLLASSIASLIPYLIARGGSEWVVRKLESAGGKIYEKLRDEGFMTLLLLRLIPLAAYNVLNYAAGLAGIRLRDYVLATFIGTIPGIFIFTYLADSIARGVVSGSDAFVRILIAGALLAALALLTRLFASRVKSRIE